MTPEQKAMIDRAIANGNPVWLLVDGIGEDECLHPDEKSAMIAYAESHR